MPSLSADFIKFLLKYSLESLPGKVLKETNNLNKYGGVDSYLILPFHNLLGSLFQVVIHLSSNYLFGRDHTRYIGCGIRQKVVQPE